MNRLAQLAALVSAAASPALAQVDSYWVTFDLTTPLTNVFVSADEWNGSVYAWDLFPAALGTVPLGRSSYSLGTRNIAAWAVVSTAETAGVGTGINSSINPPTGLTFETVFPTYTLGTVRSNIATLFVGGAYNTPQAFYVFEYILANEDTLKTDFPTGQLTMYIFNNGTPVGTASFSNVMPCYPNCDGSTIAPILNANDFQCFLNRFAAGDPTANCDGSTVAPVLNANDFQCFLNSFAAGCT